MPYRLKIKLKNGTEIISPFIAPDNPSHDWDHYDIPDSIGNIAMSMMKRLPDVQLCTCIKE